MIMGSPAPAAIPFRHPDDAVGSLNNAVASRIVAAASDIALVVDRAGVVRDLSVASGDLAAHGFSDWLDRPWIDTVSSDSRQKVTQLLADADKAVSGTWREINHPGDNGSTVPIRYLALEAGDDGRVIVIGRDLQSNAALQQRLLQVQQSVERDYLRLRQAESRYRLLFQTSSEPVLIVEAASRRIREANTAASRLSGKGDASVIGQTLTSLLHPDSVDTALGLLTVAKTAPSSPNANVRLAAGNDCEMSASMFRQDKDTAFLVRLIPLDKPSEAVEPMRRLEAILERISDAFVVTDGRLKILTVNPAFLDLAHLGNPEEARDQPLDQFLGRPQIDLKVMLAQLRDHGNLRNFATVVRGRFGEIEEVEVSAVSVPDAEGPCFGFVIRSVGRRLTPLAAAAPVPRSVQQLTQLVGRMPMKDIVRESTDLIESLCVEAALTMTSNNRASAADLLGLSRQSLYSKLRRYGIDGPDDAQA